MEGGCTPATSVTFSIGNQEMGPASLILNTKTHLLEAKLTTPLLDAANSTEFAPGEKTVTAVFNEVGAVFNVVNPTTTLTILPEDPIVTYTGSLFVSTSGTTSSRATVTLSATIQDISDGNPGNIRKARVRFINRDTKTYIGGWLTPGLVTEGDLTTGTVTYNWTVDIGSANSLSYTVGIVVDDVGYYQRNQTADNTVITISKPLSGFVTGGGYLILTAPSGLKAGDIGTRCNFGFNVKYNRSGRSLQGSINTIVCRTESDGALHVYQVKGNAMTSLAFSTVNSYPYAVFDGKASIQDITDPLLPIAVDGNASLHVEMIDLGDPGTADSIAITVWNKDGGLWLASNWNGVRTIQQALDAGNLKVSAGGITPPPPPVTMATTTKLISSLNPSAPGDPVTFTATVIPQDYTITTVPTGKITFYDDGLILRTVSLVAVNGVATATYSTSKLPIGKHAITAGYAGDRNFAASTSKVLLQTVGLLVGAPPGDNPKGQPANLYVVAYPNPAPYTFTLEIGSSSDQAVSLRVTDMSGRVVEVRNHIAPNTMLTLGENYRPGTYLAEVQQGDNRDHVLLIRQSD